jgi:hypothetical protein
VNVRQLRDWIGALLVVEGGLDVGDVRPVVHDAGALGLVVRVDGRELLVIVGEPLGAEVPASRREAVEGSQRQHAGMTVQLERVRCGKPTCKRCPHGPYWYGYFREGGRLRSVYIGKRLPRQEDEEQGAVT